MAWSKDLLPVTRQRLAHGRILVGRQHDAGRRHDEVSHVAAELKSAFAAESRSASWAFACTNCRSAAGLPSAMRSNSSHHRAELFVFGEELDVDPLFAHPRAQGR